MKKIIEKLRLLSKLQGRLLSCRQCNRKQDGRCLGSSVTTITDYDWFGPKKFYDGEEYDFIIGEICGQYEHRQI